MRQHGFPSLLLALALMIGLGLISSVVKAQTVPGGPNPPNIVLTPLPDPAPIPGANTPLPPGTAYTPPPPTGLGAGVTTDLARLRQNFAANNSLNRNCNEADYLAQNLKQTQAAQNVLQAFTTHTPGSSSPGRKVGEAVAAQKGWDWGVKLGRFGFCGIKVQLNEAFTGVMQLFAGKTSPTTMTLIPALRATGMAILQSIVTSICQQVVQMLQQVADSLLCIPTPSLNAMLPSFQFPSLDLPGCDGIPLLNITGGLKGGYVPPPGTPNLAGIFSVFNGGAIGGAIGTSTGLDIIHSGDILLPSP
jgi:hypothetical protein